MNETEKMFELTQKTYDLVEGIFGSYSSLNKLYENSIKDYDEQNNRLKEAFDNAQKNLEEIQKIKEGTTAEINKIEAILKDQSLITQSVGQIQKSIDDFNAQTAINEKDMNDAKAEIFAKKKEIIDSITSKLDELQNQKDDILRLLKSYSNVDISGREVFVRDTSSIIYYRFEDGTVLDGVDFINEKADNGVDKIIDKAEISSMLSVGNGVILQNNYKNETGYTGSYFTLNEEAKIGFFDSGTNQNNITMKSGGTFFDKDIFVQNKKVLLEGDINTANSNQKFFLEEGAERHVPLEGHYDGEADKIYLDTNLNPYGLNPYGYPFLDDKENYCFLSPEIWERKIGNSVSTIDFVSTNGINIIANSDEGSDNGSDSGKFVFHNIGMGGSNNMPLALTCRVAKDSFYDSSINIQYTKINNNSIIIRDEAILINSHPLDYDTSDSPYPLDRSSINISPKQIDINSKSFTYNGREVLFK